jgi:hypothetical protein
MSRFEKNKRGASAKPTPRPFSYLVKLRCFLKAPDRVRPRCAVSPLYIAAHAVKVNVEGTKKG